MPAIHVIRSITINAPRERVMPAIEDFGQWPAWSPWLYMERDAALNIYGDAGQAGHGYDWSGEIVGAGDMKLTGIDADTLKMDLTFLKPFKSKAKVALQATSTGDNQTAVSWSMDSSLPFFLFFMSKTMTGMIGMDYDRGLRMLKDYVEHDQIASTTDVAGVVDIPSVTWVGARETVALEQISDSMQRTMGKAEAAVAKAGLTATGTAGAIYHKTDLARHQFDYTGFVAVDSDATAIENVEVDSGKISGGRALKVTHKGSYRHVGNAWSTAMGHQRHQKLKMSKSQPPFELYLNDPRDTDEADLLTEIYLPLR